MKSPEKDYIHRSWLATAALIAVLAGVSFIPPQEVWGIKLRRANILSDLITFDDSQADDSAAPEPQLFDEEEFHIDLAAVVEQIEADTLPREVPTRFDWSLAQDTLPCRRALPDSMRRIDGALIPIEDFSDSSEIIKFANDPTIYDYADDMVVLFVDTENVKGVVGGTISKADKPLGTYVANAKAVISSGEVTLLVVDVTTNEWH